MDRIQLVRRPAYIAPSLKMTAMKMTVHGGARRDRTADLLHAMQALSQLSYGPKIMMILGLFDPES